MTPFDIFVAVVLGFCLISSLKKGLVREVFSLLAYAGGYFMAIKYQDSVSAFLVESIPSTPTPIAKLVAFVVIYIVTAIIISLMGKIAKGILWSGTDLSLLDRILGAVAGLAKGVVILVAITFPLQLFPDKVTKKFTKDSYTAPYLAEVLGFISQNPHALNSRKKLLDFDMEGVKEKFNDLKEMKKLKDTSNDLKKKLQDNDKPQDQYSPEDREKLADILKSVNKN